MRGRSMRYKEEQGRVAWDDEEKLEAHGIVNTDCLDWFSE